MNLILPSFSRIYIYMFVLFFLLFAIGTGGHRFSYPDEEIGNKPSAVCTTRCSLDEGVLLVVEEVGGRQWARMLAIGTVVTTGLVVTMQGGRARGSTFNVPGIRCCFGLYAMNLGTAALVGESCLGVPGVLARGLSRMRRRYRGGGKGVGEDGTKVL